MASESLPSSNNTSELKIESFAVPILLPTKTRKMSSKFTLPRDSALESILSKKTTAAKLNVGGSAGIFTDCRVARPASGAAAWTVTAQIPVYRGWSREEQDKEGIFLYLYKGEQGKVLQSIRLV
ncbi:MAG: hypothetical protein GOMPHAMPRED_005399 [Gomphillus americanus]|uniref:Uncharacterized protein n=1 Tax=Gomphillus americanus TaxID=1940652 RepID=A0A8H3FRI0_9LECA|nr:MAG: hypothetical protein GOMPHAMPRED_005399 [Gomphillus americanus]